MQPAQFILKQLDRTGNCILPGLGNIRAVKRKADIHPIHHTFNPPSAAFYFFNDTQANLADGFLDKETTEYLSSFAASVCNQLTYRDVQIDGVGALRRNSDGTVLLIAEKANMPQYFGLSSFVSKAVERTGQPTTHTEVFTTHTKTWQSQKTTDLKNKRKSRTRVWPFALAAVFLLIVAAVVLFVYPGYIYRPDINLLVLKPNQSVNVVSNEESTTVNAETIPGKVTEPELPQSLQSELDKTSDSNPDLKYYIVIGSFKKSQNASALLEKLEDTTAKLFSAPNGFTRVAIPVQSDSSESYKALSEYRHNYDGAWLLKETAE